MDSLAVGSSLDPLQSFEPEVMAPLQQKPYYPAQCIICYAPQAPKWYYSANRFTTEVRYSPNAMKPQFELVSIPEGCSIRVLNRRIPEIPFEWHHHPEFELTLTLNSRGWRFVADHLGEYGSHDLILVPPEMPHTWASTKAIDAASPHVAIVIWFTESWALQIADLIPEYAGLRNLLDRATCALSFPPAAGSRVEACLPRLLAASSQTRLRAALDVLLELAEVDAAPLATPAKFQRAAKADTAQFGKILNLLHEKFAEPICIEDVCKAGSISRRSLQRLFEQHLGESVTEYLRRLRVGRACMWLVETAKPISTIAADAGFANLSNFNRSFRSARGMSPKEFRNFYWADGAVLVRDAELSMRPPSLEKAKVRKSFSHRQHR